MCAVLLNAGALRRIGPNRTWVELSRRWAARGVPTVRMDLEGIGDSDGDERSLIDNRILYGPQMIEQTVATLDQLAAVDLPPRFVLGRPLLGGLLGAACRPGRPPGRRRAS